MNLTKKSVSDHDHYIVAIGASAGGLEAIHEFFDNMPSNGNLSFVIIQHLSPDYKSLLVELVSKHTNMQVNEAKHGIPAEKNHVYVIPNNKLLTISNGHLELSEKNFEKAPNTAIDTFLRSLAADQGSKAIAIILSGTGTDGSRGIQAIQDCGGMVLVQDPVTAKFDGMPNSAIATGFADYILAPELMPEEIYNYINERPVRIASDGKPDENLLPEVLKLIEKHCHYDFYNYKTPTILRRIGRRMGMLGYNKFTTYLDFLRNSPEECRLLGKEFLIGVTKFFRDTAAFKILREETIPELIRSKNDGEVLKIWVTACSTGEEAYSMAILVDDILKQMGRELEVKIFATDIDIDAIEFASKATYPSANIADIEEHLQKRYFIREGNNVIVLPALRKQIVFARHNILKDPPFIKNDMISCRNMLIYMNNILQRKVLSTLQFSLNTGGVLFLGPSEIPASVKDGFTEINGKWKLYRKVASDNRYNPERFPSTQAIRSQREVKYVSSGKDNVVAKELADDFKNLLTEEYGFAAVYIDKNFEIKEAVGDFKNYLSLPDRIGVLNILKMVDKELSVALNTAVRKALKENKKISLNNIRVRTSEKEKAINLYIRPSSKDGYILIVLGEHHEITFQKSLHDFSSQPSSETSNYISELEDELKETRHNLQMAIESMETTNEELQSSNEELLSANEELQSSNEELQSLNEELHTLNTEHQLRIRELIELNDDLNNYFRSTEIAQVFVDGDLRIRKFNPVAVKMINLIESDIGRPIEHISTNIKDSKDFVDDIQYVISTGEVVEKEVQLSNGSSNLMKILPYVRQDKKTDGVVITFIDVTNIKELDNIIKGVFNASVSAIMAFKAIRNDRSKIVDLKWIASNYATDELLKKSKSEYIGQSLKEVFPQLLNKSFFEKYVQVISTGLPLHTEIKLDNDGRSDWYDMVATQMMDGIVISLTNINEKKLSEEKFRENYFELMKVKENYRNLNIELEEKVNERTNELSQSEERFRLIANATSDAIWDWDIVNNNIWWSESFYTLFGFSKLPNKLNRNFWLEHIHPDDRDRVKTELHEAINSGSHSWSSRYRFLKSDKTYARIWDKGSVLTDSNGTPYRMLGAMMDVTEVEEAEFKLKIKNDELQELFQEFKFVTDFMPQMVWVTRPDGYHDYYNKGWYEFTGLTFEETKNEGWSLVLHPDDYERTWKVWNDSLATGKTYQVEYRMRRYDGQYRWFLARAVPLKNEEGKILKWFGTCTDIHDQKLMNDILEQKVKERTEELQKMNLELESSNNELLQFASVASHDLKEPLRKIHMFSNLIKDRYLSDADGAMDYMNRIIAASARMTKLINDLLTFTRLSVNSTFEVTDMNVIVDEVLSDLELSINEMNAVIEVDELPQVEIITGQMRQVFQNIISNALKFSKKDKRPHIKITSCIVNSISFDASPDAQGDYCRIVIKDNGIGFDNQYAEKIFTIFQRLHAREKYDGTGIGLAITRKIIEKHNGIITAKSKEGDGASFIIVLPLKQEADVPVHSQA
ncbi:MAG TPA: chemotaxis protein CheB [Flavisolibacter sp.]|nr:chemotaxis protein CheB [Flavisolibacter sp.]